MIGARLRRRLRGYEGPLTIAKGGVHAGNGGTSINTGSLSYGVAADAKRRVMALIVGTRDGAARTLNSCTIGGVTATIHGQRADVVNTNAGITATAALASAIVTSGTSGVVNTGWSGGIDNLDVVLVGVLGLKGTSPLDVDGSGVTSGTASVTLDTVKRSLIVGACGWTNSQPDLVNMDFLAGRLISLNRITWFGMNDGPSYPTQTVGIGSGRGNIMAMSWK